MLQWIDRIPLLILVVCAVVLGFAPFASEPHLVQKLGMLSNGALIKPIDIFDLFMHGTPAALLILRVSRMLISRSETASK